MGTWDELLAQEENEMLWRSRLQRTVGLEMPTTYRVLTELWGITQPAIWMKTQLWKRDYPGLVRIEPAQKAKEPNKIYFEPFDSVKPPIPMVEPQAEPMVEKPPVETWVELPGEPLVEEEPEPIDEPPPHPPFINSLTYDQVVQALAQQGVTVRAGDIEFNPLDWNSEAQRGGLEVVVQTGEVPIIAVGRFDAGWLVTGLTMGADERV